MMIAWTSKSSIFTILIQPVWARQHCCPSFQSKLRVLLAVEGALGGGCLFWVVGGVATTARIHFGGGYWYNCPNPPPNSGGGGGRGKNCIINTSLLVPPGGHSNSSVDLDSSN